MKKGLGFFSLVVVILLLALISCTRQGPLAESKKPIRISHSVFPGYAHAEVAKSQGFFEKNGVDVQLITDKYGANLDAFEKGQNDGALIVYADALSLIDKGIDAKVVYISDNSFTSDVIVGKPEFTSLKDLRGKNVGVSGINSFSHLFLLKVLEKQGLNEGDVFVKDIDSQQVVSSIEKGEVVAGHTFGHGIAVAKEKNYSVLATAGDVPGIISDVLIFRTEFINNHPNEVKAIVKSLFEGKEYQNLYPKETAQNYANIVGSTPEIISSGISEVSFLNLEQNAKSMKKSDETSSLYGSGKIIGDFFLERGQISKSPDLDNIIESKFVNELSNDINR